MFYTSWSIPQDSWQALVKWSFVVVQSRLSTELDLTIQSPGRWELRCLCLPGPGERPELPLLPGLGHWKVASMSSPFPLEVVSDPGASQLGLLIVSTEFIQQLAICCIQWGLPPRGVSSIPSRSGWRSVVGINGCSGVPFPSVGQWYLFGACTPFFSPSVGSMLRATSNNNSWYTCNRSWVSSHTNLRAVTFRCLHIGAWSSSVTRADRSWWFDYNIAKNLADQLEPVIGFELGEGYNRCYNNNPRDF